MSEHARTCRCSLCEARPATGEELAAIVWGFEFARPSCECGALLGLYRSERWHGTLCPQCDEPHARELERLDNGAVH